MIKTGALNLILRGFTLVSKFALLFFVAKHLSPEDLGVYGLVATTLTIATHLLGLDFYTYSTREVLTHSRDQRHFRIRDQFAFHTLIVFLAAPILVLIFTFGILPWKIAPWFFAILFFDLFSQEMYRILAALSRPLYANWTYFFRSAFWALAFGLLITIWPETRKLDYLWPLWFVSVALSVLIVRPTRGLKEYIFTGEAIDWSWIWRGILLSTPFLISSISYRISMSLDRYVLERTWGMDEVGAYTFFATISNIVPVFAETGIAMILYPKLITLFHEKKFAEYRRVMRKFALYMLLFPIALLAPAALLIHPVLGFLHHEIYAQHLGSYWILLAVAAMTAWGMVPQIGLYSQRLDRPIIISALLGFAVAIAANFALVPNYGTQGAALATLLSVSTITIFKSIAYWRSRKNMG